MKTLKFLLRTALVIATLPIAVTSVVGLVCSGLGKAVEEDADTLINIIDAYASSKIKKL